MLNIPEQVRAQFDALLVQKGTAVAVRDENPTPVAIGSFASRALGS